MRPFEIFVEDSFIGTGMADHGISHHYLCPTCGNIWARTIFNGETQHFALSIRCPEHDVDSLQSPAIMFYPFRFYNVRWPTAALVRDFLYLMEKRERFTADNLPQFLDSEPSHDQHQAA